MSNIKKELRKDIKNWKQCPKYKSNLGYGLTAVLGGCALFWNMKSVFKIKEPYPLVINAAIKGLGIGLLVKALADYVDYKIKTK